MIGREVDPGRLKQVLEEEEERKRIEAVRSSRAVDVVSELKSIERGKALFYPLGSGVQPWQVGFFFSFAVAATGAGEDYQIIERSDGVYVYRRPDVNP